MEWFFQMLWWYVLLFSLGIAFLPWTKKIFHGYFDIGYPFAKTIGILVLSYSMFAFSTLHILPFYRESLLLLVLLFIVLNYAKFKKIHLTNHQKILLFFQELTFFCALLCWTVVRGQEPSIHGLEKFMYFGFMNSILRSTYFPPLDMWLSGHTINYYFFGHLTGSVLTKLSGLGSNITYNFILATIFALGITHAFSLTFNIIHTYGKKMRTAVIGGILGSFLMNFAGNLHTIYLFTKGYNVDNPPPFWQILSSFNPTSYWYPNATRFIPFTIHEFPLYSYVVADLHGHVFDIPFVLLTLAILFKIITEKKQTLDENNYAPLITTVLLGFMLATHYMTNAWDILIYGLLTTCVFFFLYGLRMQFLIHIVVLAVSTVIFTLPFSLYFSQGTIVSGIGVNCSPEFLIHLQKLGPFLFEKDKCQSSPLWMLFILWGFFWIQFIFFSIKSLLIKKTEDDAPIIFILMLFTISTFLIIVPEFFYMKDIYPNHFRANTMFKLGYQAFIMMSIASAFTFAFYKTAIKHRILNIAYLTIFIVTFIFVAIYPNFAIPSYYGTINKMPQINGTLWLKNQLPDTYEIVGYLNAHVKGQPTILEAQGDSYTDYNVISSYTGLPTVAGWWVHEWLWRGSSDTVGVLIPSIQKIYESSSGDETFLLLKQFNIQYVIISNQEREKYPQLNENKFFKLGDLVFTTSSKKGHVFKIRY